MLVKQAYKPSQDKITDTKPYKPNQKNPIKKTTKSNKPSEKLPSTCPQRKCYVVPRLRDVAFAQAGVVLGFDETPVAFLGQLNRQQKKVASR